MAVTDGRDLRIKIGGFSGVDGSGYAISDDTEAAILLATNCSLNISGDMLESATKDDVGKWKSKVLSGLTATLTHSGLLSTEFGAISDHWASLIAGTEFYWEFTAGSARSLAGGDAEGTGSAIFSGKGIFTGMSIDAGDLQNSTLELPIEVTGPVQCVELTTA